MVLLAMFLITLALSSRFLHLKEIIDGMYGGGFQTFSAMKACATDPKRFFNPLQVQAMMDNIKDLLKMHPHMFKIRAMVELVMLMSMIFLQLDFYNFTLPIVRSSQSYNLQAHGGLPSSPIGLYKEIGWSTKLGYFGKNDDGLIRFAGDELDSVQGMSANAEGAGLELPGDEEENILDSVTEVHHHDIMINYGKILKPILL
ncbi:hypothetical protein ACJX0J_014572, partial [Zea mays]